MATNYILDGARQFIDNVKVNINKPARLIERFKSDAKSQMIPNGETFLN